MKGLLMPDLFMHKDLDPFDSLFFTISAEERNDQNVNSLLAQMRASCFDSRIEAGNNYFNKVVDAFFEQEPYVAVPTQEQLQTAYMLFTMAYVAGMVGGMTYWPQDGELHLLIQEKRGGPMVGFTIYQDGRHSKDVV